MLTLQNLASLVTVIVGIAAILSAAWVITRSKAANVLRDERDAWQERATRVDDELKECKEDSHGKDVLITELRAKTDLTELTKGQAAMLANQTQMLKLTLDTQKTMLQMTHTLEAMEKRLDRGLVMS